MDYGGMIRRLREGRGLTMEALADTAGISTSYLSEVERGLKRPSTDVIAKIADALAMRPSELLERVESSSGMLMDVKSDVASPRLRARYAARSLRLARAADLAASPEGRDESMEALVRAAQELSDEDLGILLELATRLNQARKR